MFSQLLLLEEDLLSQAGKARPRPWTLWNNHCEKRRPGSCDQVSTRTMFLLATFELLKDHPRGTVSSWQKPWHLVKSLSVGPLETAICAKGSAVCGGPGFLWTEFSFQVGVTFWWASLPREESPYALKFLVLILCLSLLIIPAYWGNGKGCQLLNTGSRSGVEKMLYHSYSAVDWACNERTFPLSYNPSPENICLRYPLSA